MAPVVEGETSNGHETSEEDDQWALWGQLVSEWNNQKPAHIKEMVRKGIPSHFRGISWQLLCNAQSGPTSLTASSSSSSLSSNGVPNGVSQNGRKDSSNSKDGGKDNSFGTIIRNKYAEYLRQSSPCEKIIKRDIARTYPEIEYFRDEKGPGQVSLFNVMKAYSIHDAEVGYCQGSAFLVGVLLLQMPEEDAFAVFVKMMEEYKMREIYKPTFAELGLCMYQLECMVQESLPELHRHFESQNYYTSMYASSWFLTLFTSSLPLHLSCRVIDLFLSEGLEIIFRISIGILILCREDLLKLDMEGLLKYFQKEMPVKCDIDPDYLVSSAFSVVKIDTKKMKKQSKDYNALKSKEQEEMVELRRLRTENRLLRQRIENLETESGELADKLIQGQVSRAQEAEDNFVIKRELANYKRREEELSDNINQLNRKIDELRELNRVAASHGSKELQLIIESLQEELVAVKLREAETNDEMRHLRDRLSDLEEVNHRLRDLPPEHAVAQLQEELISVKLREAEANLSMKELRGKITDLHNMWEEHMVSVHTISSSPGGAGQGQGQASSSSEGSSSSQPNSLEKSSSSLPSNVSTTTSVSTTSSNIVSNITASPLKMLGNAVKRSTDYNGELNRLKQELMSAKLRESEAIAELKCLRQKVMELETSNQVSLNQIRRQNEDMNKVREIQDCMNEKQRETYKALQEEKRKFIDLDSRYKEMQMMNRIKDLEQTQAIAELKQKLSSFEIKKEEIVTEKKLIESGSEPQDTKELHDRMSELQSEMFRLEISNKKLNNIINNTNNVNNGSNNDGNNQNNGVNN